MIWSEERSKQAADLWSRGFSASEIAKEIGGVTRNAVIGRMHRLGVTQGVAHREKVSVPSKQRWHETRKQKQAAARALLPAKPPRAEKVPATGWQTKVRREPTKPHIAPVLLTGAEKPWIDRKNGECCYPIGEGADMLMCCQPSSEATRNLCAYHFPICYVVGSAMKPRDVRHYERKAA